MLPRYAALARHGHRRCPIVLLTIALLLGGSAQQLRAGPGDFPERVKGRGDTAGEVSVTNNDGVVDSEFWVSLPGVADLISRLPQGTVEAGDFKVDPSEEGDAARLVLPSHETPAGFDVWAEGRQRRDATKAGAVSPGTLLVGADYDISPVLTVGALAGLNQLGTVDGEGGDVWSGGPYARFEPAPNLLLTGLATWQRVEPAEGEARFDPFAEPDSFRLINQLSGELNYGAWRFTPSVGYELDDTEEGADATLDSTLNFGPKIGYRHERPNGTVIEPHLALKGNWDLAPLVGLNGDAFTQPLDGLDATLEGAVRLKDFNGWSLDASTSVGGIDNPQGTLDWSGRVGVKVPLN